MRARGDRTNLVLPQPKEREKKGIPREEFQLAKPAPSVGQPGGVIVVAKTGGISKLGATGFAPTAAAETETAVAKFARNYREPNALFPAYSFPTSNQTLRFEWEMIVSKTGC